jgi:mRNA interferase HicA
MKYSEFRRYLNSLGAEFKHGSKHDKIYLNNKQTTFPRHKGEIPEGLRKAIIQQLDIKE